MFASARGLMIAALTIASVSAAQNNYVVTSAPTPYVPLTGATNIKPQFSDVNDSQVVTPIGFAFPYFGADGGFTQVAVNTNGFISFTTDFCRPQGTGTQLCTTGTSIPNAGRQPHNVIAPYWGNHSIGNAATQVNVLSSPTRFDVEWLNATQGIGSVYQLTMKVTLLPSGEVQVHYGPKSGSGGAGVIGFEGPTGAAGNGASFNVPPTNLPCSSSAPGCTISHLPTETLYTIWPSAPVDLVVSSVTLTSSTINGANLDLSFGATLNNLGTEAANGVHWKAYLSTDRVLSAATDVLVYDSAVANAPVTVPANTATPVTAMVSVPKPTNNTYYLVVEVDSSAAYTEVPQQVREANNTGSTATTFISGFDLVANSVGGPSSLAPGDVVTVNVNFTSQGPDAPGPVDFEIWTSNNTTWDSGDSRIFSGTRTLSAGQNLIEGISFTVPSTVQGVQGFYILKVNTRVPPLSEVMTNNVVASTGSVTVRQSDLEIRKVELVDPGTGQPTPTALFGAPGRVLITAANIGQADARAFKVGLVISIDSNLSLLQDTILVESDVAVIAPGQTRVLDVSFTFPRNNAAMQPFATGNYFFFGLLDSSLQITELSETNNNMVMMQPVVVRAPAADFAVTRFEAPSAAGTGETVPVFRVFKNLGNEAAAAVKYRYYVSANSEVTSFDTPCRIMTGGNPRESDTAALPVGGVLSSTELIEVPPRLTPGTYYLGALLDPDAAITELDEANNGLGSLPVLIVPSALRIATPSLPDAVVGRPYYVQLTAAGETPGQQTTWSIDEAQGALPAGLQLSMSGVLSGTPTADRVTSITVVATNGGAVAVQRFALRVLPTTTQVEITTVALPVIVNSPLSAGYETYFGAAGGQRPYRWSQVPVAGELLPRGLTLTSEGRLFGTLQAGVMEKPHPITVEVRDALGTTSRRSFNVRVVGVGSIVFENVQLSDGVVGGDYVADIVVRNFDRSPLVRPLTYRVVAGGLPDGIAQARQGDRLLLQGTPTVAGTFAFTLEVEDGLGRNDSADFVLRIYAPSTLKVVSTGLPARSLPGDALDVSFSAEGVTTPVALELYSGTLPAGTMFSTDGRVSGTIDAAATQGTYNFSVLARDGVGNVGIGSFSLLVKTDPTPISGCGCSAADAGFVWAALLVLARRRRKARAS
ncbi:MAG: putative Ig domain-containing protein [Myxococcaceae bacterium]|nr:putative Ig domain-containing protein [Myxococcaceae bacterium]